MEFSEAIQKLRSRLGDAISLGVGEDNPAEFTMAALIQVMNEAERHRQDCLRQMVSYRELAKGCEFQASAYCQMHSLIYSVYNNLITAEEKAQRERREVERRKADALTEAVNATEVASAAAIVDLETAAIVEIIPVTPPVALPSAVIVVASDFSPPSIIQGEDDHKVEYHSAPTSVPTRKTRIPKKPK